MCRVQGASDGLDVRRMGRTKAEPEEPAESLTMSKVMRIVGPLLLMKMFAGGHRSDDENIVQESWTEFEEGRILANVKRTENEPTGSFRKVWLNAAPHSVWWLPSSKGRDKFVREALGLKKSVDGRWYTTTTVDGKTVIGDPVTISVTGLEYMMARPVSGAGAAGAPGASVGSIETASAAMAALAGTPASAGKVALRPMNDQERQEYSLLKEKLALLEDQTRAQKPGGPASKKLAVAQECCESFLATMTAAHVDVTA